MEQATGMAGIEVSLGDVHLRPFVGAATLGPDGTPDPRIPLRVTGEAQGPALRLTLTAEGTGRRGLDPGRVVGLGAWRSLDLSRYAEPYGQRWWPKAFYSETGDFWISAHWLMEESSGTHWQATNEENRGDGPFALAPQVRYEPDTAGRLLPVHEVLEVRVGRQLWEVVPELRQRPSEYREELARSVFIDLWQCLPAADLRHFLEVCGAVGRGRQPFLTIIQNWEAGGWDALLPDSMWLPDYPPNPGAGGVAELRELCSVGNRLGRCGFRTNYRIVTAESPSLIRGVAHRALDAAGKPVDVLRCADWLRVARHAEEEIREAFAPTATFTDQMTSGAAPWSWHDFASEDGSRSIRGTLAHQQALARLLKETHRGPLGSETLSDQHLLGEFVDFGDYGLMDGHHRLVSPEFKLRRLQGLSAFHGMGLMYRFYEMPPFPRFHSGATTFADDPAQLDDYRACEVLYGNGGYVCHGFANWSYCLTEILLIGRLQRYWCGQPVREVRYWHQDAWVTLEDFVRQGCVPSTLPWDPPTQAFGRIRVEYGNGLAVVVNRLAESFAVTDAGEGGVVLPQAGWVAWHPDGTVLAFSAYWPGTEHRVDFLRDRREEVQYLDPRNRDVLGVSEVTGWERGRVVLRASPAAGWVNVDGQELRLEPPRPPPLADLAFDFRTGASGWRPLRGILTWETGAQGLVVRLCSGDAYLIGPALRVPGDRVAAIEIRLRAKTAQPVTGALYFGTLDSPHFSPERMAEFALQGDGETRTYRVAVGEHPGWRGQTITALRLDPCRGAPGTEVVVESLRAVP